MMLGEITSCHQELDALQKVKLYKGGKELVNLHKSVESDTWGRKCPLEGTPPFMSSLVSVGYKNCPGRGRYGV